MKTNKNNDVIIFNEELTRKNLNNEIMLKRPFYFHGEHLNIKLKNDDLIYIEKDKNNKYKKYKKTNNELNLLLPNINSKLFNNVYKIKGGGKLPIHANDESISYYFVKEGSAKIILIHPRFKDNFSTNISNDEYICNNSLFLKIDCERGVIMYVPNNWLLSVYNKENDKELIIEKITYSTMINQLILYFKKVFNNNK
jgi:hypothetical protein